MKSVMGAAAMGAVLAVLWAVGQLLGCHDLVLSILLGAFAVIGVLAISAGAASIGAAIAR